MKLVAALLLLVSLIFGMRCISNDSSLLKLCVEVSRRVEGLWGHVGATVVVVRGKEYKTIGSLNSERYTVVMEDENPCALAHELTHVVELYRGYLGEDWFMEGLADLSCYLLYPDLYPKEYILWISKGYGEYDSYFFGLTVTYYAYVKGMNVFKLKDWSYLQAAKLFARALEEGITPFGVKPYPPPFGTVRIEGKGWAYTRNSEGAVVIGKVSIFTEGGVAHFPSIALLPLLLSQLRGRRSR